MSEFWTSLVRSERAIERVFWARTLKLASGRYTYIGWCSQDTRTLARVRCVSYIEGVVPIQRGESRVHHVNFTGKCADEDALSWTTKRRETAMQGLMITYVATPRASAVLT